MPARRFDARPETILRDLTGTLTRMDAFDRVVALGGRFSKEQKRLYQRHHIDVRDLDLGLAPAGVTISFKRRDAETGETKPFAFTCTKWPLLIDNLRAAQRALTGIYSIYEDYGVTEGDGAGRDFDRLFGGFLALGDGATDWWAVLGVPRDAAPDAVKRAYHQQVRALHTDNPENRGPGAHDALVRINRAYEEARAALGVGR